MDIRKICWLLSLVLAVFFANSVWGEVISDRQITGLDGYIAAPWPDPNSTAVDNWTWGKAGYALACLYRNVDVNTANNYINTLCNWQNPIPETGTNDTIAIYFKIPMLVRIYLDPNMKLRLTATAKSNIERVLWQFTNPRSRVAEANTSVWGIQDSENHDMVQKSDYLLGLQLLRGAAGYGPNLALNDGKTIEQHYSAWKKYFFEYFRQRAREGLNCEIASNGYNKYTVGCWYNVCDLSEDSALRKVARNYLALFWADYAGDFMPSTGLRGGAETRWYKSDISKGSDSLMNVAYEYGWHNNATVLHPFQIIMFTSPYRNPAIVDMIGRTSERAPYLNTTRRFGKGGAWVNTEYTITFNPDNSSNLRRDTWWHKDYVMGSLTLMTNSDAYTSLIDQNRAMGIFYSSAAKDRIIFDGNGTDDNGNKGFAEISGVCGENCMVAAWDKNATSNSGVFLFVSNGSLLTNKVDDASDWIFTKTGLIGSSSAGDVYTAMRIASGGYDTYLDTLAGGGSRLVFRDKFSPVVLQTAPAGDWSSFTAFKNAVKALAFNYNTTTRDLTYTSLAGDTYEYWGNSGNLPKINEININLNPANTYDSPYLQGVHGMDTVTISDAGYSDVVLNFCYHDSPVWDDYKTVALWHADSVSSSKILDDDLENSGRNKDLTLYNGLTVTTGSGGKFSEALNFDGINDYGSAANGWVSSTSFQADLWIYLIDSVGTHSIINAANIWNIDITDGKLGLWTSNSNGSNSYLRFNTNIRLNTWHRVLANCDTQGNRMLILDNVSICDKVGAGLSAQAAAITVGKQGAANYYAGKIDDIKISNYASVPAAMSGDLNHDKNIDYVDLDQLADQWLNSCDEWTWCDEADVDHSGRVNFDDFALMAVNWLIN